MANPIPLSAPDITELEVRLVTQTLRSGRLSIGPRLEEFERLVGERVNRPHAVGVSSGTAGLHLALLALGIGPGDEVITPAFSFVASANCVLYVGAKPVFVDCDPRTLNMKLEDVEKAITEKTKAIIGVEVFGNPCGMLELAALAARYEIPLVEDAAEGLGGQKGPDPIGRFGRVAVFGFYPSKQITTGEGGMIVTHDDKLADLCRSMRNQGRAGPSYLTGAGLHAIPALEVIPGLGMGLGAALGSWLVHERVGYNFRLSEINAALGVAQMQRLNEIVEARERVAEAYTRRLMPNPNLIVPNISEDTRMSWFVYVVRLTDQFTSDDRDFILEGLRRHEVGASNYFPPIPLLPPYRKLFGFQPGDFPVAESVSQRTIALPFFNRLTEREIDLVCQTLEVMIQRITFAGR
ncbi:MAG: DegT/DnrJ/EryC1/StrS family aminotransferase [Phycisphaerales bacterium]|nr:DegT/DnrJ/EryC1/StrS family aminotransferase [Phycisphaerales bacterium]MCI0630966.1 DegT/DnrJ/EryC1/StrS family aminotransferase [Phycisphaerales bacterium]MCI0674329.1 DegT/DnrJ/EryC1/StrS family aminotransferase [Phycisphaerales bacterium]